MTFIQARHYTPGRLRAIRLIVWHDMEAPEARNTAENVASWFGGSSAPQASAHVCVDQDSVVECVKPRDTAWAAPNANSDGYQIEQAGYASQDRGQWTDAASLATIRNACAWIKTVPQLAHIPNRWLTNSQIADRSSAGHVQHRDITRVLGGGSHTDCGPNFPTDVVMQYMNSGGVVLTPGPTPPVILHGGGLTVDGSMGPQTITRLQQSLNTTGANPRLIVDGLFGTGTKRALQARLNAEHPPVAIDGEVGPKTWKALQAVVGAVQDGVVGPETIKALQRRLNSGEL